jgi:hypothetical protein
VVGDLTSDPGGATARQEWITELGLWYEEPTDPADWVPVIGPVAAQIESHFNQTPAASLPGPSIRPASSIDLSAELCR